MACGLYNEPRYFSNLFFDLGLAQYIPTESMSDIIRYESEREDEIIMKRDPQYRSSKNQYRKKKCKLSKSTKESDYNENKDTISFD